MASRFDLQLSTCYVSFMNPQTFSNESWFVIIFPLRLGALPPSSSSTEILTVLRSCISEPSRCTNPCVRRIYACYIIKLWLHTRGYLCINSDNFTANIYVWIFYLEYKPWKWTNFHIFQRKFWLWYYRWCCISVLGQVKIVFTLSYCILAFFTKFSRFWKK